MFDYPDSFPAEAARRLVVAGVIGRNRQEACKDAWIVSGWLLRKSIGEPVDGPTPTDAEVLTALEAFLKAHEGGIADKLHVNIPANAILKFLLSLVLKAI